jgi:cation-transporting ATPase 13A3/4/5
MTMPCDCILISGEVYVNEVTLTGESIPVPKFEASIGDGSTFYEEN